MVIQSWQQGSRVSERIEVTFNAIPADVTVIDDETILVTVPDILTGPGCHNQNRGGIGHCFDCARRY